MIAPRDDAERRRMALRQFMKIHGLKVFPWARKAGISEGALRNFLNGKSNSLSTRTLDALAGAVGVSVSTLLGESGHRPTAPIVGYLDHGTVVVPTTPTARGGFEDAGPPLIEAPPAADGGLAALLVRDDDLYPVYRNGDVIFHDRARRSPHDCLQRECLVKLAGDGGILIKVVVASPAAGRFTLIAFNAPPIENVRLDWAAPIAWVKRGLPGGAFPPPSPTTLLS